MNEEQKFLITIMEDYVNEKVTNPSNVDMEKVYYYSQKQQLHTLMYYQCRDFYCNENIKNNFFRICGQAVFRNIEIDNVIKAFASNSIEIAIVKGYLIEKLYSPNYLRTMGDVDFIIHLEDRKKAHQLLINCGYSLGSTSTDEWTYRKNSVCIEVHSSMVHTHKGNEYLATYFNNLWNCGKYYDGFFHVDWSFHFCYLIQHISGHLMLTGIGFRPFLDLAIILKKVNLDWDTIKKELESIELWEFALKCLAFCEKWFKVAIPIETPEIENAFFYEATEKMFSDGVFGHDDKTNANVAKVIEKKVYSRKKTKVASLLEIYLEKIFPPYNLMVGLPHCMFLQKHKILLPLAWMIHIIKKINCKLAKQRTTHIHIDINDHVVDERLEYIKRWGL